MQLNDQKNKYYSITKKYLFFLEIPMQYSDLNYNWISIWQVHLTKLKTQSNYVISLTKLELTMRGFAECKVWGERPERNLSCQLVRKFSSAIVYVLCTSMVAAVIDGSYIVIVLLVLLWQWCSQSYPFIQATVAL